MKKVLIVTGVALLAFASLAGAQGYQFSNNLTVGSTGADVVALQQTLMAAGYDIPAISSGAATTGYFGTQTKEAVVKYQTANGIPSTGFVGPLTRAALNGSTVATNTNTSGVVGCPAGYVCTLVTPSPSPVACPTGLVCTPVSSSTTPVTTPATPAAPTGITTPGVTGILSVTPGPISTSVLNVGQQMVPVLAVRAQAQYSDIAIQYLSVDLGTNTTVYNKIFSKLYVTDGTNVLASVPLNSSTVVQNGNDYVVGLAGFNIIVPKGTYKDIIIKADLYGAIDSSYLTQSWSLSMVGNSVRGVDGAGVNLYGPLTAFSQTITINKSLVDNAQANISLDPASPLVASVPVTDTTNNQYLGLPVLIFDVNAQNDNLHLHNVTVRFNTTGTGNVTAAYLFQGSTQIMSAGISGNVATFSNITDGTSGADIPVNTTVPFTVKVDVTGVTSAASPFNVTAGVATTSTSDLTIYNTIDSNAIISGSALGNTQTVASTGPLFTLVGTPTMTKSTSPADTSGNSTTTYVASFNINVQAVGSNVNLGLAGSSTPAFATTTATGIDIYKNGSADTLTNYTANGATIVSNYSQPTNTVVSTDGTYFTLARNQSVTLPVTYSFVVKNAASSANTYALQLQGINWEGPNAASANVNFMKNQIQWRTPAI